MKLEDQIVSLELAKRLKELGVKQESYFAWYADETRDDTPGLNWFDENRVMGGVGYFTQKYSAFSVAELGEMLGIWRGGPFRPQHGGETEADYRAHHLISLIEQKVVKP